jgi:hypothetical protein
MRQTAVTFGRSDASAQQARLCALRARRVYATTGMTATRVEGSTLSSDMGSPDVREADGVCHSLASATNSFAELVSTWTLCSTFHCPRSSDDLNQFSSRPNAEHRNRRLTHMPQTGIGPELRCWTLRLRRFRGSILCRISQAASRETSAHGRRQDDASR